MKIKSAIFRLVLPPIIIWSILLIVGSYYVWHHANYELSLIWFFAAFSAVVCLLFLLIGAFFLAHRIVTLTQQLKDSSLAIAAGDFKDPIQIQGPQELVELGDTMNMMRECLQENTTRLKESSAMRERMHGEYECALLLQHEMLQGVIDKWSDDRLFVRLINLKAPTPPHGLLLQLQPLTDGSRKGIEIRLYEALVNGFYGIYDMLTHTDEWPRRLQMTINEDYTLLTAKTHDMPLPLVWSTKREKLISFIDTQIQVEPGDLIFLYNHGFSKCFENPIQVQEWFHKVLRHFASEGLDLFLTMFNCEINFLSKRQHIEHDINILCIQI